MSSPASLLRFLAPGRDGWGTSWGVVIAADDPKGGWGCCPSVDVITNDYLVRAAWT